MSHLCWLILAVCISHGVATYYMYPEMQTTRSFDTVGADRQPLDSGEIYTFGMLVNVNIQHNDGARFRLIIKCRLRSSQTTKQRKVFMFKNPGTSVSQNVQFNESFVGDMRLQVNLQCVVKLRFCYGPKRGYVLKDLMKYKRIFMVRGHGGWTSWTPVGNCSAQCGGGTQTETRTCTNPVPTSGGNNCQGNDTRTATCNTQPCPPPTDGGWTSWQANGNCSVSCGGGVQEETRTCTNPAPYLGGQPCSGDDARNVTCNTQDCPACEEVVIIVDSSDGVTDSEFDDAQTFIADLVNGMPPASKVAIINCGKKQGIKFTDTGDTLSNDKSYLSGWIGAESRRGGDLFLHQCISRADQLYRDNKGDSTRLRVTYFISYQLSKGGQNSEALARNLERKHGSRNIVLLPKTPTADARLEYEKIATDPYPQNTFEVTQYSALGNVLMSEFTEAVQKCNGP